MAKSQPGPYRITRGPHKGLTRAEREARVQASHRRRKLSAMELLPIDNLELFELARDMLTTGPTSQRPRRRAIDKMMRYLIASPLHKLTMRHVRAGWRTWPRRVGITQLRELNLEEKYYGKPSAQ